VVPKVAGPVLPVRRGDRRPWGVAAWVVAGRPVVAAAVVVAGLPVRSVARNVLPVRELLQMP